MKFFANAEDAGERRMARTRRDPLRSLAVAVFAQALKDLRRQGPGSPGTLKARSEAARAFLFDRAGDNYQDRLHWLARVFPGVPSADADEHLQRRLR